MEAAESGAVVRNHCEVLAVDVAQGRARGVLLRDRITGKDERVEAGWIVNCTGPWADRICQRSAVRMSKPMLGGVRGSHIVLPRFSGAPSAALYTEAADKRPVFVVPWNDQILVGTNEVADTGDPAKAAPSNEEIEYLLRTVSKLFPKAKIAAHDIKYAFAGVRPLPNANGNNASAVTRRHFLHDHTADGASRLISVIGGKLTTAASLARECARKIGITVREPKMIAVGPGGSLDPLLDQEVLEIARAGSVSEETARGMMEWHGPRAMDIARMALVSADCVRRFVRIHIIAEVVEAYRNSPVSLGDVLLRRIRWRLGPAGRSRAVARQRHGSAHVLGWKNRIWERIWNV